jgi:WhiB family transcriptional regulator, redox-sensing transcriptional regulator
MSSTALIAVPGTPSWAADPRRMCAGKPLRMFFPHHGDDTTKARQLCGSCPFKTACQAYALDHKESGIWGGLDDRERYKILRADSAITARRPHATVRRDEARWLAGQGLTHAEIADQMGIGVRQVERHLSTGRGQPMSWPDIRARESQIAVLVGQGFGSGAVMRRFGVCRSTAQRLMRRVSDRMQVAA